jgi:predicted transcriptional regulator
MAAISLRLPDELESLLDEEARREGVARSEIARAAIAGFLAQKERQRTIAAFVAEARAAYARTPSPRPKRHYRWITKDCALPKAAGSTAGAPPQAGAGRSADEARRGLDREPESFARP